MERLSGTVRNDNITGYGSNDRINGGYGNDALNGGNGDDRLNGGRGEDTLIGGNGNDVIISRSDTGETAIAQAVNATNDPNSEVDAVTKMIYANQARLAGDDILTGGGGADEFRIETLIGAKAEILLKHTDPNTGIIDYSMNGVAGENNLVHDHWLDGIGNDVITDFNQAEGDTLSIKGHTTEVYKIEMADVDGDGSADDSVLHLRSNQGGPGAHNLDLLGTISVLNNALTADDFTTDAGVVYGIVRNISQLNEAISPLNPASTGSGVANGQTGEGTSGTASGTGTGAATEATGGGYGTGAGMGHDHGGATGGTGSGSGTGASTGTGHDHGGGTGTDTGGTGTETGEATSGDSAAASVLQAVFAVPAGTAAGQTPTSGDDVIMYAATDDRGNGGRGADMLIGLDGKDSLSGGWGDDLIDAGAGDDHVHGGYGNDVIGGFAGNDLATGDFGDDMLFGGAGADQLRGGRGEDVLFGGADDDVLSGGAGDDILLTGAGNDTVNGGGGTDALLLTGAIGDYTFTVAGNTVQVTDANGETDAVSRVEQFHFLGNGETYEIANGSLVLATDTGDLEDLISDHLLEDLIAEEIGTDGVGAVTVAAAATTAHSAPAAMDLGIEGVSMMDHGAHMIAA